MANAGGAGEPPKLRRREKLFFGFGTLKINFSKSTWSIFSTNKNSIYHPDLNSMTPLMFDQS